MEIERTGPAMLTVRFDDVCAGWRQSVFLGSDLHWDHPKCNRHLVHKHLRHAKEQNAPIFFFGDTLCGMQGKGDPRASKDELDAKFAHKDYLDRLVNETAADLADYPITMLSMGNHEGEILDRRESNLVRRLAQALHAEYMGYAGYIRFLFNADGKRSSRLLYFVHGSGNGGVVTRGVISTDRRSVYQPQADVIVSAHIHEKWAMSTPRVLVTERGHPYLSERWHLQCGAYKQEYDFEDGDGWAMKREMPPKAQGGWWLDFSWDIDYLGRVAMAPRATI